MAQVSLRINGYAYILGCADGEEDHLRSLADDLDQRIESIKASAGPSGEARLLLMAALVLSDELHDLKRRAGDASGPAAPADKPDRKTKERLGRLARRAETIAVQAEMIPAVAPPPVEVTSSPDQTDNSSPLIAGAHEAP